MIILAAFALNIAHPGPGFKDMGEPSSRAKLSHEEATTEELKA